MKLPPEQRGLDGGGPLFRAGSAFPRRVRHAVARADSTAGSATVFPGRGGLLGWEDEGPMSCHRRDWSTAGILEPAPRDTEGRLQRRLGRVQSYA